MKEVAAWMIQSLGMILTFLKDNPAGGVLTFVLFFPVIKLLGRVLRLIIKTN